MVKPKKSLGQHFLSDRRIARRIVEAVSPSGRDAIIEIGPGEGALTRQLLDDCGFLVCIEIDRELVERLRGSIEAKNLSVIEGDALQVNWGDIIEAAKRGWSEHVGEEHAGEDVGPVVRLVANLPYYISTPLIQILIRQPMVEMTLMLQREVVDRIIASPGGREYGYFSVLVQYYCEAQELFEVSPSAFRPPPKVKSAVIRLRKRATPIVSVQSEKSFFALVRAAFAQRRKTIHNNLKAAASALGFDSIAAEPFLKANIDPKRRAETLSIAEFAALHSSLFE